MPQTRKLAAIMFTDIVGYTALMGNDEEKAFSILELNRKIHKQALQEFNGTWLKEIGDGVLASFNTITDAVFCAKKIQEQCSKEAQFSLRIGIHQGEVVFDGEDVFGDGVNLASRIQSAAPPGCIYLSESVARNIDNKKDIETRYVGEKTLKNVSYPVRIYEVIKTGDTRGIGSGKKQLKEKFSHNKKRWLSYIVAVLLTAALGYFAFSYFSGNNNITGDKSVAILPFRNLNPGDTSDFFVTAVHEDVINRLAGLKDLKVISRTTVMRIKQDENNLITIGKKLGANFIVEGSVSRINNQIRVMVQLFDAKTEKSLWSDSYDRELSNVFSLQAEIAGEISGKLKAKISSKEKDQMNTIPTDNLAAYDDFIRARTLLNASQLGYDKMIQAIGFLEKATAADKNFTEAWSLLSQAQSQRFERVSNFENKDDEIRQAATEAEKALNKAKSIDPGSATTLRAEGYFYNIVKKDPVRALRSFDQALEVFPNDAKTLFYQVPIFLSMKQLDRVVDNLEKAYAINNSNPGIIYGLTFAYELTKQYKKMGPFFERLLELEPEKTHYAVEAKYYKFLSEGSLAAYTEFENAVKTIKKTDVYDERAVENKEMVVAMLNDEFEQYKKSWVGKWDSHYKGHGDWSCPMIINEEANHANLLLAHGDREKAGEIIQKAKNVIDKPINENALCIFDKIAYTPKLYIMSGDSLSARKEFEEAMVKVLKNDRFPRGTVEKSVLLQTADMVAPDKVFSLYKEISNDPVSFISLEVVCANPWTYPNLLKHPEFIKEVRKDGRFVKFLEHYRLIGKA